MQNVMAELRQLGTLDPAAQDQLLENLRESDFSLWPLVVEQFRSTMAYRQRVANPAAVAANVTAPAGSETATLSEQTGSSSASYGTAPVQNPSGEPPVAATPQPLGQAERLPDVSAERLPAAGGAAVAPTELPREICPAASGPTLAAAPPANQTSDKVVLASYTAPATPADWRQQLDHTIKALETEAAKHPDTDAAQQARLRMLYAAAGRRADAVRPISATPPAGQQFLAKEMEGLSTWLGADGAPDTSRRVADAKAALGEALAKLTESAPLAVRNLAFCTEIQSYGCMKRFEKYEFQPNQEVLLYAEVENFISEPTPKGYHTSLRSHYQVLDARGQPVAEHSFAATEEYCQNRRHDFFIGYHLRLPKGVEAGRYCLRLKIEDLKSQKSGEASIEFEVRAKERKKQ